MTASSPVEDKARTRESSGTWRLLHGEVARDLVLGGTLSPSLAEVVVEQGVDEELCGFAETVVQRGRWGKVFSGHGAYETQARPVRWDTDVGAPLTGRRSFSI